LSCSTLASPLGTSTETVQNRERFLQLGHKSHIVSVPSFLAHTHRSLGKELCPSKLQFLPSIMRGRGLMAMSLPSLTI
jgi:hypothetical protein